MFIKQALRNSKSCKCDRGFFWGSKSSSANTGKQFLIDKEEEMKVMQYRGNIEDFNKNARTFELYLQGKEAPDVSID